LIPLITEYAAQYPKVRIDLQLEDAFVDLIAEQVDVALRVSHLSDSSLVACKLANNPYVIVAAPSYLTRRGEPANAS
jgi:DNA-binding transcriptional LysR family regulator